MVTTTMVMILMMMISQDNYSLYTGIYTTIHLNVFSIHV